MKRTLRSVVGTLTLAAIAFGQGAGSTEKGRPAQEASNALKKELMNGPGAVQESFFESLKHELGEEFGSDKGAKLFESLCRKELDPAEALELINGKATTSRVKDLFGTGSGDTERVRKSLDKSVGKKNRQAFSGIMIFLMIDEFDMDPTGEFCGQVAAGGKEMSEESFGKLRKSNVSTRTVEEAFGFENKEDCKLMQEILNSMGKCLFVEHPMLESLGMGGKRKFDPSMFPGMEPGLPGSGEEFAGGMAGGLAFDAKMPPCPFAGEEVDAFFEQAADSSAETR